MIDDMNCTDYTMICSTSSHLFYTPNRMKPFYNLDNKIDYFLTTLLDSPVESCAASQVQGPWFDLGLRVLSVWVFFPHVLQFTSTVQKHATMWIV